MHGDVYIKQQVSQHAAGSKLWFPRSPTFPAGIYCCGQGWLHGYMSCVVTEAPVLRMSLCLL